MLVVTVGGFFGAAAREAFAQGFPTARGTFPTTTLLVNLAGAFLLGFLLEALVRVERHHGGIGRARLLAGTGFLGAFTTYSTLAVETALLVHDGRAATGLVYAAVSVSGGLGACGLGLFAAAGFRRRPGPLPVDPDVDPDPEGP